MKYCTAGESHGPALVAVVTDVPAGFALSSAAIDSDLARRQSGYGRGGRMKIEHDRVEVLSGLRFGRTLGSPLALRIENRDWANWSERMAAEGRAPRDLKLEQSPRPGHADLVGALKTGTLDCRDVLERASARETAARVAAGAVAKAFLANFGVEIGSYVTRIGPVELPPAEVARKAGVFSATKVEASAVRCPDEETSAHMMAAIDDARKAGESLGGWFVVTATGLVPGLGSYAEATDRLTGRIGGALLSIPAIKGLEFGLGFAAGTLPGSQVHDPIVYADKGGRSGVGGYPGAGGAAGVGGAGTSAGAVGAAGAVDAGGAGAAGAVGAGAAVSPTTPTTPTTPAAATAIGAAGAGADAGEDAGAARHIEANAFGRIRRASNNAGGLEGGMTTGEPLIIRAVMKPIPTMTRPLATIDLVSHEAVEASKERSDVCAVPAAAVVAEAELALVLANAYMDKFGRDALVDIMGAFRVYVDRITAC